ncbi:hypothetical protein Tco_0526193 [Tanacetum coccineum]
MSEETSHSSPGSTIPRLQEEEDLQGDDLLYYDAEMELMNIILLSISNEIYNSVDSSRECQKPKWAKDAAYHKENMLLCKQEELDFS